MKTKHPPRRLPWRMCRTCHRKGVSQFRPAWDRCDHALRGSGECGQCGKRRPLVECHKYDFRSSVGARQEKPKKPIPKVGKSKAKRVARNKAYYSSAEWRAKRKAVFERDGYRCTVDSVYVTRIVGRLRSFDVFTQCPNRGEVVNGKQTARGLVCEERSYGHRGVPGLIDTCTTRCKDCDRALTPFERANHAQGFRG